PGRCWTRPWSRAGWNPGSDNKHDDIVAAFLSREGEILSQAVVSGEGQAFRPRLYVLNGTVWVIWSESSAGNWKLLALAEGAGQTLSARAFRAATGRSCR
ncbi:hypothetical protein, partial [Bittarella massiliensis (ex Durand et al. 2017)]